MNSGFKQRLEARRKERYRILRALYPDTFRKCVGAAATVAINHELPLGAAAAVEQAMIDLALEVLCSED